MNEKITAIIRPPGTGCHASLLSAANRARRRGMTEDETFRAIREGIPTGKRTIPDAEIRDAIRKAFSDSAWTPPTSTPRGPVEPPEKVMGRFVEPVAGMGEVDLLAAIREDVDPIPDNPAGMAAAVLSALYDPADFVFVGDRLDPGRPGRNVRQAADWAAAFSGGAKIPPFVIPNPMTGREGHTKDGRPSFRCDDCIAAFRFVTLEFDGFDRETQLRFYLRMMSFGMPVAALIDSGNKSVHAWVRVDAADRHEWEARVENDLFHRLGRFGADRSCRNEARLSRMPGHVRDNGRLQQLLYLNPAAGVGGAS